MSVYTVRTSNRKAQRRAFHSRAWLNGVNVTTRCFYADPRRGVVRLYLLNVDGKKYKTATGEAATAEFRGRVIVRRMKVAP
jgi:hypothetical protein